MELHFCLWWYTLSYAHEIVIGWSAMKFCTSMTNYHRFKKGAVVSGTAFFVHCGTIGTLSDVQAIIIIGCSAMKFCTSMRYFY